MRLCVEVSNRSLEFNFGTNYLMINVQDMQGGEKSKTHVKGFGSRKSILSALLCGERRSSERRSNDGRK